MSIVNVDTTDFPKMKATFFVIDKNGNQIFDFLPTDFNLKEIGTPRKIFNVSCNSRTDAEAISSVLLMDASYSMYQDNIPFAKEAAKVWIENMQFQLDECAITCFNDKSYYIKDFTQDTSLLLKKINNIFAQSGSDFNSGFNDNFAGAFNVIKKANFKKIIVVLVDGNSMTETYTNHIIDEAKKQNTTIYAVALKNHCPKSLKEISEVTGGKYFENIQTIDSIKFIYKKILYLAKGADLCTIEWESDLKCEQFENNLVLNYKPLKIKDSVNFLTPYKGVFRYEIYPPFIDFSELEYRHYYDTTITIKAINGDLVVSSIISSHFSFAINPGGMMIKSGDSTTLRVEYSNTEKGTQYSKFKFINNNLCNIEYSVYAGKPLVNQEHKTLEVIEPNGKSDLLYAMDSIEIKWDGIPPSANVRIEYSQNDGKNWEILSEKANGLKFNSIRPFFAYNSTVKMKVRIKQIIDRNVDSVSGILWEKVYGYSFDKDYAASFCKTINDEYYLAGTSKITDAKSDLCIVKTDNVGNRIWYKAYGGKIYEEPKSILQTNDDNIIISAKTNSTDLADYKGGRFDAWIFKIDSSGQILWQKTFGGSSEDNCSELTKTSDGGFVMIGYTNSNDKDIPQNKGKNDVWILKLDSLGNIEWSKTFGGTNEDKGYSILQKQDEGFIFIASSNSYDGDFSNNKGLYDIWIVELDKFGNIKNKNNIGGSDDDYAYSIIKTTDNHYLITGNTKSSDGDINTNKGNADVLFAKIDNSFNVVWLKTFGGKTLESCESIIEVEDGYFIVGYTYSKDGDLAERNLEQDVLLMKYDKNGNFKWYKLFGGTHSDYAKKIISTSDSGLLIFGTSESIDGDLDKNEYFPNMWLIKVKPGEYVVQEDISDTAFTLERYSLGFNNNFEEKTAYVGSNLEYKSKIVAYGNGRPVHIDSVYISGEDAKYFDIQSKNKDFYIYQKEYPDFYFSFAPDVAREYKAEIIFVSEIGRLTKGFTAKAVNNPIKYVTEIIDFGQVLQNNYKDTSITNIVENISSDLLVNSKFNMLAPGTEEFKVLYSDGEYSLGPGGKRNLHLRFEPKVLGRYSGRIALYYDDIPMPTIIQLQGRCVDFIDVDEKLESNNQFMIFPNPGNDYLDITNLEKTSHYEIFSLEGILQVEGSTSGKIDISMLSKGLYYIKIDNDIIKFLKY
jgi:hypothetical protein